MEVVFGRFISRLVNVCHGPYTSYLSQTLHTMYTKTNSVMWRNFRLDAKSVYLGWGGKCQFLWRMCTIWSTNCTFDVEQNLAKHFAGGQEIQIWALVMDDLSLVISDTLRLYLLGWQFAQSSWLAQGAPSTSLATKQPHKTRPKKTKDAPVYLNI